MHQKFVKVIIFLIKPLKSDNQIMKTTISVRRSGVGSRYSDISHTFPERSRKSNSH